MGSLIAILHALLSLFFKLYACAWPIGEVDVEARRQVRSSQPSGLISLIMSATYPSRLQAAP